jgi:hypothetical protein
MCVWCGAWWSEWFEQPFQVAVGSLTVGGVWWSVVAECELYESRYTTSTTQEEGVCGVS